MGRSRVGLVSSGAVGIWTLPEGQAAGIVGEGHCSQELVLPRRDDGILGRHAANHPVRKI
jgi:hypothetical protein